MSSRLDRWDRGAAIVAFFCLVVPAFVVLWPWLGDTQRYGFHDWDVMTSHRYLAVRSLREHGELPGWNPYACGGFPAWGYVEGATNVVSPFLPLYWWLDIRLAIRLEVLGMALLGAWGSYLAAGTLTESRGARALVAVLFATNGRFGLQAASGHGWHLAYAILPWVFWCFERSRTKPTSMRHFAGLAIAFAMLVYAGGIYPLPHTLLFIGAWALGLSLIERSPRPLLVLAGAGASGLMLAAPKLFPVLAAFERAPRVIESNERLAPGSLWTLLVSRQQGFFDRPAPVTPYGWHEWGMYVSLSGVLLLVLGLALARGAKAWLLKVIAVGFAVLGMGAFHPWSPWSMLHALPVFRSQHVPSRFLYPAVFVAALVLAIAAGEVVSRTRKKRPWLDAAVALVALAIGVDVASVAAKPMAQAMTLSAPEPILRGPFVTERRAPLQYQPRDWAAPMYLAMRANTGVLECYGAPPFDDKGAIARRDPRYRGEVFVAGEGAAELTGWTPNHAIVALKQVRPGARLVYNTNFDAGWHATIENEEGQRDAHVRALDHRVSLDLPAGDSTVTLAYTPPGFGVGVLLALLTAIGLVAAPIVRRRLASLEP